MKVIVVISVDVPTPGDITQVLEYLDPQSIPHFAGKVRIAIEPVATQVETWLDE
jgi:hypothetical protein